MTLVVQVLEDGHRVRVPIFNETRHDFDSELAELRLNGCNKRRSDPLPSMCR